MAYKIPGGVPVIGTLTQSLDSDFPIVIADNITLTDGTSLEEIVVKLRKAVFGEGGETIPMSEIDDSVKSLETTWSSEKISRVISDLKDEIPTFDSVYTKDEVYSKSETDEQINSAIETAIGDYVTQQQLSGAISNAIDSAVSQSNGYTDTQINELSARTSELESLVGAGFEPISEEWILSFFQDEP